MRFHSLKTKLLVELAAIFLIIGISGTLINMYLAKQQFHEIGEMYTSQILQTKVNEYQKTFQRNINTSLYMAESPIIVGWMKKPEDDFLKKTAFQTFKKLDRMLENTDTFVAVDSTLDYYFNGVKITTLSKTNSADNWYWSAKQIKQYDLSIDYNDTIKTTKLWVNVPVKDAEGRFLGVIGTGLDISDMIKKMIMRVAKGAQVMLFDDQGIIKGHRITEYINKRSMFSLLTEDKQTIRKFLNRVRTTKEKTFTRMISYQDREYMASLAYIPSTQWFVMILMDINSLLWSLFTPFILLLIVSLMIILISLIFMINRMVLRPLSLIDSNLAKVKEKDFDISIQVKANDEFKKVADTINLMATNIKDYTENLETRVAERTVELKEAFDKVHSLKVQQDGDYFLTSLLINPLIINEVKNDHLDIEFYLKQKKTFTFRKREGEIGGDICIARRIELHGKKYSVFINGDAMGKSLQGAGGALVLGVVFNAYVGRSSRLGTAAHLYPEKWLQECYNELQHVFVSFDGSMLISVVVGIVDEETGLLYFFNAEHPWTVLYRDNQASFLETELSVRKLGTVGYNDGVHLQRFQLQPDDVIIMGSDGRDDLMLGIDDETGMRVINEDETHFLDEVSTEEGDLNRLVNSLQEIGELTDDISLLKIHYHQTWREKMGPVTADFAQQKDKGDTAYHNKEFDTALAHYRMADNYAPDETVISQIINCCRTLEKIELEAEFLERGLHYFPMNMEMLRRAAIVHKAIGNYRLASEYGERFRIYYPENVDNLINLSDAYRLRRLYRKARELFDEAKNLAPEHRSIPKLLSMLKKTQDLIY